MTDTKDNFHGLTKGYWRRTTVTEFTEIVYADVYYGQLLNLTNLSGERVVAARTDSLEFIASNDVELMQRIGVKGLGA